MVTVPFQAADLPNPGSWVLGTVSFTAGPMPAYLGPLMAKDQSEYLAVCTQGGIWTGAYASELVRSS